MMQKDTSNFVLQNLITMDDSMLKQMVLMVFGVFYLVCLFIACYAFLYYSLQ